MTLATLIIAASNAFAFDPPKPNPYLEKALAEKGVSIDEWLLFDGIRNRNIQQIAYAIAKGADVNEARDIENFSFSRPPLIAAVTHDLPNEEIVVLLIDKGARLNQAYTPKPLVPESNDPQQRMVVMLWNASSPTKRTPLHFAAASSTPLIIMLLIKRGADIEANDSVGQTPLFDVPPHRWENAEALLKAGARINTREKSGKTLLYHQRLMQRLMGPQDARIQKTFATYIEWLTKHGATE